MRFAISNILRLTQAGYAFAQTYRFLNKSQYWTTEQLREYQFRQLQKLIRYSYHNIPFYREQWERVNFHPNDLKTLDDIKRIPFTTKQIIQENIARYKERYHTTKGIQYVTTGGSAGIPLGFFEEKYVAMAREIAFIYRLWERAGYRIGDKRVVIRGKDIKGAKNGAYSCVLPIRRELRLSLNCMTDERLSVYIKMINDYRAPFIHAFPSSITILADYIKRKRVAPFPFLKAILVGSENLYDWQKELIEDVFGCRVYSWYGHSEKAVLAGGCEEHGHYHIFPEYGIVELIDSDGNQVTQRGCSGEIVATGFNNYVTPFIRYRTMDIGVVGAEQCSCGRNYPILEKIEGRLQELLVSNDNRLIPISSLNMHNTLFDNIRQFQFYQERKGEVDLNLVRAGSYSEQDDIHIRREISEKLGNSMRLNLKYLDKIPQTSSGKFRLLVQKLPVKYNDK
ncbi:MAG TPA: CoF synthetase [candidate division Zixibacteria bacterium]|nr:CoF synthetase [candidate division Zixibacteria bacterium]